ncbi:hypothetical protein DB88DRAFT_512566 [Papiliotrema laurentii]|uniref:Uncharacterized protein n=1 Tax=Papiliotrema laurentii TaxID=5418 RepID=A0AAD9CZT0_PAPLA|nr:hypothetical protein DB88DRAFT_512566 [Papiliotrema laurentii]
MDSTALTLPPYLVDRIKDILLRDVDIPRGLRRELQSTLDAAEVQPGELDAAHGNGLKQDVTDVSEGADGEKVKTDVAPPPTIEIEMVERLARWSTTAEGEKRIRKAKLDPGDYTLISLLAGTQVYIPPAKLALLESAHNPDKPNPYLPTHLSPRPGPLHGYKALNKQISTILNIAFSIFGSGGAVYVAATTGAGYTRERSVILAVLAGVVVGLAELVLIWIFVWRIAEARKHEVEQWRGSAGEGIKQPELVEAEGGGSVQLLDDGEGMIDKPKTEVRLRRRGIGQASST